MRLPARLIRFLAVLFLLLPLGAVATAAPAPAAAGTYRQVTGFGSNPGNLQMFEYVPAGLPSGAPLVVALHGCTQSADAYHAHSGWAELADRWGFAVVYPQTTTANNIQRCFQWFEPADYGRGRGEAASIVQMVSDAEGRLGSDGARVFVTGLSAGGGMTANLLAAYPDVFAGGSIGAGLPAACASSLLQATSCQMNDQGLTPEQWGDRARGLHPGYAGPWPRVAIWQGTADYTVRPVNADELRDQWTDVHGVPRTPSSTHDLPGGTTRSVYGGAVEVYSIAGMGHGLPVDPGSGAEQCGTAGAYFLDTICSSHHTAVFWGLDGDTEPPGTLPAPGGLHVTGTSDAGVSLAWDTVDGAASYVVRRDGANAGTSASGSFTDTGLAPGTSYAYTVAAVDAEGRPGPASAPVTATTTGAQPRCFTATNYAHVAAGRARTSGGYVYANGSNENMGLYNVFVTRTLKETSPGYFVIAGSGC
ncbi:PHB depolymerase family esterase [Actinomadura sp. WMMB 499]|uniref:extracellular catalytic domain type 1 short-chain-length polyhydroxyalkanoate depolymerase n=1 Tax=Actinomadura sp. WMMB 499 TaxID=1219491 RepID=UPI001243F575|nr:PHB depolymerase family esterase [Actinomadura sp. WMMB 499]QFG22681.1 PHB depolymerase family esterase [Actinomadura sp. WMMB 499]